MVFHGHCMVSQKRFRMNYGVSQGDYVSSVYDPWIQSREDNLGPHSQAVLDVNTAPSNR